MKRWILSGIVIVGGAMVIACGDQRSDAPVGPVASVTALTTVPVCDLSQTSSLVAQYFNATDAKTVRDKIDQIGAVGADSVTKRNSGFDIIAIIARNAQEGTGGDASKASDLINKISVCMFRDTAALPTSFPEDYTVAITTAAAGGLGVRGATDVTNDPVVSRDGFSRVAPKSGETWASTLSNSNPAPARVAFFGRPGSTALSYDWKVLPRNAKFRPPVVIGLCISSDNFPTTMVTMRHDTLVNLLAFEELNFVDPVNCRLVASRGAFSAITSQLAQLFLPKQLTAAAITRGIGGSSGGIGSEFSPNEVPNVSLRFTTPPPTTVVVDRPFSVEVRATHPVTGLPVPGTSISIVAVNNNGVQKDLVGTSILTTGSDGLATFSLRFAPGSTGGFRLIVSASVINRPAIKGQLTSKINVKPK